MNILTASAEDIKRGQAFKVAANKKKRKKRKTEKVPPVTLFGANG